MNHVMINTLFLDHGNKRIIPVSRIECVLLFLCSLLKVLNISKLKKSFQFTCNFSAPRHINIIGN
jgi:hypothetical protein